MRASPFSVLLMPLIGIGTCAASQAWAQRKYTSIKTPATQNQFLQEHMIGVGDAPGHQLRGSGRQTEALREPAGSQRTLRSRARDTSIPTP